MITEEAAATLLADLVRIESVTPWLIPDGSGERDVAEFLAAWVSDLPVEASIDEIQPGRVNLVVRLPGDHPFGPDRVVSRWWRGLLVMGVWRALRYHLLGCAHEPGG